MTTTGQYSKASSPRTHAHPVALYIKRTQKDEAHDQQQLSAGL